MLTNEQAKENLKKYGPNELEEGKKKSVFQIFLEQFKDFLVIILIISAVISGFLGDVGECDCNFCSYYDECDSWNGADGEGRAVAE